MKVTEEERKIISWISNYFTKSSYKKMLVDLTNFDLESAFLCYLCKKTQQPIVAVICGENQERDEFCKLFKIQTIAVSLSSKDHIIKDCNGQTYQGFEGDKGTEAADQIYHYNCLSIGGDSRRGNEAGCCRLSN